MKKIIMAVFLVLMNGCASVPSDFSQDIHAKARSVALYASGEEPEREFTEIKKIKSNSCNSDSSARLAGSLKEAELLLRLEAASIGADAVTNYSCKTGVVDLVSNCWASKKCSGIAVKYNAK